MDILLKSAARGVVWCVTLCVTLEYGLTPSPTPRPFHKQLHFAVWDVAHTTCRFDVVVLGLILRPYSPTQTGT